MGYYIKPEDFDSTKNYPMIIYFYEKYADDIHRHYIPKPTASIIYATEYVSNGYIVFYSRCFIYRRDIQQNLLTIVF